MGARRARSERRSAATHAALAVAGALLAVGGCGGGTRVVVTVNGDASLTGITAFDVTYTNAGPGTPQSGSLQIDDGGNEIVLPADFGLRLEDAQEGTIEVCVVTVGTAAAGCTGPQPLVLGGRTDLLVTLVEIPQGCGNGARDGTEACDDADLGGADCLSILQGFGGGSLACAVDCTFDTSGCTVLLTCGNGALDPGEACDGAPPVGVTCAMLGFDGGTLGCTPTCTTDTAGCYACGDGVANGTEMCDDLDLAGQACTSIGLGFVGGDLDCDASCAFDTAGCTPPLDCGNGIIDTGEDCDEPPAPRTCSSIVASSWDAGTYTCTGGCVWDLSDCSDCGNGVREGGEACDGTDLGTSSCLTIAGLTQGSLTCNGSCAIDATSCWGAPTAAPTPRRPRNNLYLGSTSVPGSLVPTFEWEGVPDPFPGLGPAITYELQYYPAFAGGTTVGGIAVLTHTPVSDLPVSMTAPVGDRYYWHVRACKGVECGPFSTTWWVNVGRATCDFNGDGFADVAVGAPQESPSGIVNGGAVYAYFGAMGAFNNTADGIFTGATDDDQLGISVACAGDVDADGFGDLLVGANAEGTGDGYAFLFFGGSGTFGSTFAYLDDGTFPTNFGISVAPAGDVDADGFDDVIVGASGAGSATLFRGAAPFVALPDVPLLAPMMSTAYGCLVEFAGDLNGDGFADVAVGASGVEEVYVYFGNPGPLASVPDLTLTSPLPFGAEFGVSGGSGGDLNGDSFADLVLGANAAYGGATGTGEVFVAYGAPAFSGLPLNPLPAEVTGSRFGFDVDGVADWDGDGDDELIVGAFRIATDTGEAYVYEGDTGGVDTMPAVTYVGVNPGDSFGTVVGSPGDVNGNGAPDLAIGAYLATGGAGEVHILYAGGGGVVLSTAIGGSNFGYAVTSSP